MAIRLHPDAGAIARALQAACWISTVSFCLQPRLVYKDSVFHKQTNSTWAREDPAYIITLTVFMLAAAVAYGVAFSEPIVEFGFLILEVVIIHLYLASAACATIAWIVASTRLKSDAVTPHAMGGAKVGVMALAV